MGLFKGNGFCASLIVEECVYDREREGGGARKKNESGRASSLLLSIEFFLFFRSSKVAGKKTNIIMN